METDRAPVRLPGRAAAVGPTLFVAAILVVSVWAERPELRDAPVKAWASIPVGVGFAVTAALIWHERGQRWNAALFAAMAVSWVSGRIAIHGAGATTVLFFLVSSEVEVLAVAALLRYPGRALERWDRRFVQVSAVLAVGLMLPIVLTTSRADLGGAPAPWPDLWSDPGLSTFVRTVRGSWLGISAVVFLLLLLRRWRRLPALERHILLPIVATSAVSGLLAVPVAADQVLSTSAVEALNVARSYAATAVAFSFVVSAVQLALTRSSLVRLVSRLSGTGSVAEVEAALRETLADADLEVWYHLPETGEYVDGRGVVRDADDLPPGRSLLRAATAAGEPLAAVLADRRLERHQELVGAAVELSRLALENARLEAGLRAQLVAVREARARLLATALDERRRLERDLHDGAQQRLLALTMRLSAIESGSDPATARAVADVRVELHHALQELRDLARGIYPAVLTQGGLAPALEAVTEGLPVPVRTSVPTVRYHPDVESAAYLVICEALTNVVHHAGPCRVELLVDHRDGDLHIEVVDDGAGSVRLQGPQSLRKLRDRVGAFGGRLDVRSEPGVGTALEAWIPCA